MKLVIFIIGMFVCTVSSAATYNIQLNGYINDTSVAPLVKLLNSTTDKDVVYISITSPGGEVDAGDKVLRAMEATKAKKIAVVNDYAMSMAALITIHADEVHITPKAILMFHVITAGGFYKFFGITVGEDEKCTIHSSLRCAEPREYIKSQLPFIKTILTDVEIDLMQNGADVYISGEELNKRNKHYILIINPTSI